MDVYACPKGHQSTEPDFCSECGARIQVAAAPPASAAAPAPLPAGEACPDCGAARAPDDGVFCEVCGYNFTTGAHGEIPVADPPPQAPVGPVVTEATVAPDAQAAGWAVVVTVDPSLREAGSPDPPAGVGPFTITLDKPVSLIGRRSDSHAIFPEIPLNCDDAVSHRHALLQRGDDGSLALRDLGASNGTRLNGKDVEPLVDTPLRDDDQITLGHWTRIAVKAVR
jgi:FHA domain